MSYTRSSARLSPEDPKSIYSRHSEIGERHRAGPGRCRCRRPAPTGRPTRGGFQASPTLGSRRPRRARPIRRRASREAGARWPPTPGTAAADAPAPKVAPRAGSPRPTSARQYLTTGLRAQGGSVSTAQPARALKRWRHERRRLGNAPFTTAQEEVGASRLADVGLSLRLAEASATHARDLRRTSGAGSVAQALRDHRCSFLRSQTRQLRALLRVGWAGRARPDCRTGPRQ